MHLPRSSGILLHPTSLPGPHGSGDLGPSAYHFVDWLVTAGQSLWQILPLGGIGPGNSPYMSSSAFAGNVLLIDLGELQQHGWLEAAFVQPIDALQDGTVDFAAVVPYRMERLSRAARHFAASASVEDRAAFNAFCAAQSAWLADYSLFMALAERDPSRDWCDWEPPLALREPAALARAAKALSERVFFWQFTQWCFFRQWQQLKAYANGHGVKIVGDAPIFIAYQSADVWARPELFELDAQGRQLVVAGVPPDYFSATGQRWGNPLYRWDAHAAEGYAWWTERIHRTFEAVDIVRIDHFRGFAGYWEIAASEPTAINGRWLPGPGEALFDAIEAALGPLPIIAEDLGIITPDVEALRKRFALPGMRILQFAFSEERRADASYLPHHYERDTVVYTGTHDNDTTLGWWVSAPEGLRQHVRDYLATDGHEVHWDLMRAACSSVADTVIHPMQDVLGLGTADRMNFPGKPTGNWSWRFTWDDVPAGVAGRLQRMGALYGRGRDGP